LFADTDRIRKHERGEAAVKEKMRLTLIALAWALILLAAYAVAVHAQTSATDNQHTAKKGVAIIY